MSEVLNQKNGVFAAVCSVTECESWDSAVELTKEQRDSVISIVTQGLIDGNIEMSDKARVKYDTEEKMKKYTPGLVSNHLRKDLRLNGDIPHEPKNPGSRAGSGDVVIKELKKFQSTFTDPEQIESVQVEIDKRLAVLKSEKMKDVEIDMSLIPDDLKELLG